MPRLEVYLQTQPLLQGWLKRQTPPHDCLSASLARASAESVGAAATAATRPNTVANTETTLLNNRPTWCLAERSLDLQRMLTAVIGV
jgi:hypothetical protein